MISFHTVMLILIGFVYSALIGLIGWFLGRETMRAEAAHYVLEFADAVAQEFGMPFIRLNRIMKSISIKKQFFR